MQFVYQYCELCIVNLGSGWIVIKQ